MKSLSQYLFESIPKENDIEDNNKCIYSCKDYSLWIGNHGISRKKKHLEEGGELIRIEDVKNLVDKAYNKIDSIRGQKLIIGDKNYIAILVKNKSNPKLNIVLFIKDFLKTEYHLKLQIKTIMNKNNYLSKDGYFIRINEALVELIEIEV